MTETRYVTDSGLSVTRRELPKSTPIDPEMEDEQRFRLYRLCPCGECGGTGKSPDLHINRQGVSSTVSWKRCGACRGEGKVLDLVATCGSPEACGVALVTLGREQEWAGCSVGLLDSAGAKNEKWIILPWAASPTARNISDAARVLARSKNADR